MSIPKPNEEVSENIAATLARVLPEPQVMIENKEGDVHHVALPAGYKMERVDSESLLPNPRRTVAKAIHCSADSFTDYVLHHHKDGTVIWCNFNPQTYALGFTGVIDDHAPSTPGWRSHSASYTPELSVEWKAWQANNGKYVSQVDFAEWLEEHEEDIAEANGLPTLLQMKEMATNFVARQDMEFKSAIRLQDGSVRMQYVADSDAGTVDQMRLFERFVIGIPVFYGMDRWQLTARLKYRVTQGKVQFRYELVRPDRTHESAAKELIEKIKFTTFPVANRLGTCT